MTVSVVRHWLLWKQQWWCVCGAGRAARSVSLSGTNHGTAHKLLFLYFLSIHHTLYFSPFHFLSLLSIFSPSLSVSLSRYTMTAIHRHSPDTSWRTKKCSEEKRVWNAMEGSWDFCLTSTRTQSQVAACPLWVHWFPPPVCGTWAWRREWRGGNLARCLVGRKQDAWRWRLVKYHWGHYHSWAITPLVVWQSTPLTCLKFTSCVNSYGALIWVSLKGLYLNWT